ncbi:hypothetical protein OUZ56_028978 [Daphnia magna]|uniref:Uncharacterized protein n=1 Tax=Daphnia magna TaxID=35525 RepID=A0ABR0B5G3_9CRUS|nr:hypothetical protein OUZ56_028978 [Daphnia magna]
MNRGFASDRDATHMKTFVKGKAPVMQLKLSLFCFSVFSVNYFNLLFENQQQQKSVWKVVAKNSDGVKKRQEKMETIVKAKN